MQNVKHVFQSRQKTPTITTYLNNKPLVNMFLGKIWLEIGQIQEAQEHFINKLHHHSMSHMHSFTYRLNRNTLGYTCSSQFYTFAFNFHTVVLANAGFHYWR